MQSDLTESVQASIRPGEMVDSYYYGETNLEKQAYPCVVNTRFVQQFTNLGGGSSQFVISPQQGVSDIVVELVMPALGSNGFSSAVGYALPTGWGYNLINRISVRYGSSAQYFFSGSQMLLQNLMDCENNTKVDAILAQGGAAAYGNTGGGVSGAAGVPGAKAYVYLKLPHNSCRADGKPLPFATDLLVQPIVVTIELFAPTAVFIVQTGGAALPGTGPTQLASAQLQVKQEMLTDTSDLLARRVDMNSHAYTFPLMYFAQQETQVQVQAGSQGALQTVNLTGFRAGEVRAIQLWLTANVTNSVANQAGSGGYLPNVWPALQQITLTYNGEIFSRFDDGSNQLWSLVQDTKLAVVNLPGVPTPGAVAAGTTTQVVSYWADCPFAQVNMPYDKEMKLMHGKPILNAVVNLSFVLPDMAAYTLHAQYIYNASLLCSRGSAEYIF